MFEFLFDNNTLISISLSVNLENWNDWKQVLQKSIRDFISSYGYAPNVLDLSAYTKSQIELVSGMRTLSSFCFMETIEGETSTCYLKFYLDDSLIDKRLILKYIPRNDDDNDLKEKLPVNPPCSNIFILIKI